MKMDLKEAVTVVLDLAEDNALDPDYVKAEGLEDEAKRQATAIRMVRDHVLGSLKELDDPKVKESVVVKLLQAYVAMLK